MASQGWQLSWSLPPALRRAGSPMPVLRRAGNLTPHKRIAGQAPPHLLYPPKSRLVDAGGAPNRKAAVQDCESTCVGR